MESYRFVLRFYRVLPSFFFRVSFDFAVWFGFYATSPSFQHTFRRDCIEFYRVLPSFTEFFGRFFVSSSSSSSWDNSTAESWWPVNQWRWMEVNGNEWRHGQKAQQQQKNKENNKRKCKKKRKENETTGVTLPPNRRFLVDVVLPSFTEFFFSKNEYCMIIFTRLGLNEWPFWDVSSFVFFFSLRLPSFFYGVVPSFTGFYFDWIPARTQLCSLGSVLRFHKRSSFFVEQFR